ncbi:MAG TPA: hypothetical protein VF163_22325 [Micromonosporaceae bacterium]
MRRLWTSRWILVHAAVVTLVTGFLWLGWWQVNRAASGNLLSYGYAIEWPAFAAFVIYVWIKEMRRVVRAGADHSPPPAGLPAAGADAEPGPAGSVSDDRAAPGRTRRVTRTGPAYDDSDDEQLAAYNRYLAWLKANPQAAPSDYPD